MSFDSTIDLSPRPSMRALMTIFVLHVIVAGLLLLAMPTGAPMAVLAGLVGLSWMRLRRHPTLGFGPRALTRLTWHAEGVWTLYLASGTSFEAELQGNSLVHSNLLVLNYKSKDGKRHSRLFAGDELEPELLRRLRARLSATNG